MNTNLINNIEAVKNYYFNEDHNLRNEINGLVGLERERKIAELVDVDAKFNEAKADLNRYKDAYTRSEIDSEYFYELERELVNKYNAMLRSLPIEVTRVRKAKTNTKNKCNRSRAWAWIMSIIAALSITSCAATKIKSNDGDLKSAFVITDIFNKNKKEENEEEKPFEVYGKFNDINNEKQLRARAEWYYDNYIKSEPAKKLFTVERIMNDMRIMNAEFKRDENGNAIYNEQDLLDVAQDIYTLANYDSLTEYGDCTFFTPMAPLFLDGSLAQQAVIDAEEQMVQVVAARNEGNNCEFVEKSKDWATVMMNEFDYVDFSGYNVNVHQTGASQGFFVYTSVMSKYAPEILEYEERQKLNICVDRCIDYGTGKTVQEPISEIVYQINDVARDANAVRSGHAEEYADNNLSLPENLFIRAKDYFNSKYNLEVGSSRILR